MKDIAVGDIQKRIYVCKIIPFDSICIYIASNKEDAKLGILHTIKGRHLTKL